MKKNQLSQNANISQERASQIPNFSYHNDNKQVNKQTNKQTNKNKHKMEFSNVKLLGILERCACSYF